MTNYTIYIDGASFTASEEIIDRIVTVLLASGYTYDKSTQGYIAPAPTNN